MEFEDVSEKVEWEARRIAVVFGATIHNQTLSGSNVTFSARADGKPLLWQFDKQGTLRYFSLDGQRETGWAMSREDFIGSPTRGQWNVLLDDRYNEVVARGLYQMGFEEESVLAQLPLLSAHEKLELRLSLPREFWPKKWLDEQT